MSYGEAPGSIDEVISLVQSGDKPAARRMVMELLRRNPDNIVAMLWLAYTSSSIEEVGTILGRVLILDPHNPKALEWQAIIREKQARQKTSQSGPLPPTPPSPLESGVGKGNSRNGASPSSSNNSPPGPNQSSNLALPVNSHLANNEAKSQLTTAWKPSSNQYQVVVEPAKATYPSINYVQYDPPASTRRWWLLAGLGLVITLVLLGAVFFFLVRAKSSPDLAGYRLFSSLEEMVNEGFVDQRVAIDTRFMGGYTRDSSGTYLITIKENKAILYVQWPESVAPVSDFRPGQFVSIYGRLTGVGGGKATLKVEKVFATLRE